jgi:NADH:ubiquinone reductase (H+-translocating)
MEYARSAINQRVIEQGLPAPITYHVSMSTEQNNSLPHILIIGGGFGGLEAAKAFKGKPVRVTLMDRTNHHLFQPLLYQVATAGLAAPSISAPIRHVFRGQKNVTTLLGDVRSIDAQAKQISFALPGNEVLHSLAFDHLILAAGATHSYFGNDAWAQHAPGLKTLQDAFDIRRKILMAFEAAEAQEDAAKREALLTFVVIGAGPTGVEMAGTLVEIARHTLPGEFRRINPASAKVILLEGGSRVLQAMPPALSQRALEQLQALGVDVRLNAKVTQIDAQGLRVENMAVQPVLEEKNGSGTHSACAASYQIDSYTIIWAAGVAASPLGKQLAQSIGCELDRAGRVKVLADLSVQDAPHVSVIGDLASVMREVNGQSVPVPGVSPAAKQMGRCAAANILCRISGQKTQAFRYADYGNLATIGRNAAVVDLVLPAWLQMSKLGSALRFSGKLAWLFWLFAHIYFLIGFRNRFVVLADWMSAYWSFSRSARVVAEDASPKA